MYSREKYALAELLHCNVAELSKELKLSDKEINQLVSRLSSISIKNKKCHDIGRQSLRLNKMLNSILY